ncbi:hypothetical protein AAHD62_18220 [Enterobacter hormaechei]
MATLKQLIECEISDFFAGFGHPGEPETPEEMQSQLLARVMPLLAGLEREPVGITDRSEIEGLKRGEMANVMPPDFKGVDAGDEVLLYETPQLPQPAVVPLAVSWEDVPENITEDDMGLASAWAHGFNQCRAAMLQGAEPVSQPCTLRDGWVAVPVDPTEKMVIEGFESVPHPLFQPADWDKYQTMSGCEQAAHRAKLCWAAMIKAAPQQGTK